ncbi:platelet glycoprotein Ib beta chain-like isoform X2 [Petromyzon marinus]
MLLLLLLRLLPLLLLLLVPPCTAGDDDCPLHCDCNLTVIDCEGRLGQGRGLTTVTNGNATTLKLRKNPGLGVIPSGAFDFIEKLRQVELDAHGWDCGCDVDYLRGWLLMQPNRMDYRHVTCSTPPHLEGRIVMYLGPDEVAADCRRTCDLTVTSQGLAYATLLLHGALVCFLASRRAPGQGAERRTPLEGSDAGGGGGRRRWRRRRRRWRRSGRRRRTLRAGQGRSRPHLRPP